MKKVGFFFLFIVIYIGCFLGFLYIFTVIINLLSLSESIGEFLGLISNDSPQFISCLISSVLSMLLCLFLANRLNVHGPVLVSFAVVLAFSVGFAVLAFVYDEPAAMYLAHIFPCLFMLVEQARALRASRR